MALDPERRAAHHAECRGKATTLQPISDSMVSFLNFFLKILGTKYKDRIQTEWAQQQLVTLS
jgi:hypothetical protein